MKVTVTVVDSDSVILDQCELDDDDVYGDGTYRVMIDSKTGFIR